MHSTDILHLDIVIVEYLSKCVFVIDFIAYNQTNRHYELDCYAEFELTKSKVLEHEIVVAFNL